jgi:hypothetical protein
MSTGFHPPKDIGSAVAEGRVLWPDRSHRTVAEAWQLTAEQIAEAQRQHEEPSQRDWRRG